jgi:hypothetical protein
LNDGAAVNLTFDEARPVLSDISMTPSTRRAELIAKPKDQEAGKNYTYRWAPVNGRIAGAEGAKATWELTDGDQSHTARVLVRSAKGLYNIQSLSVEVEAIENGVKLSEPVCTTPTITRGPAVLPEFFTKYEPSTEDQAKAYYKALDPAMSFNESTGRWSGGHHSNFAAWLKFAGFDKDAPNGEGIDHVHSEQIAYLNFNDLGFGRRMTMRQDKNTLNVYAFVTNFGNPDQCLDNAEFAKNNKKKKLDATVAMEFAPLAGVSPDKVVKFYVFNTTAKNKNNLGDAELLNSAMLDGNGPKFVPNLCVTCHGGKLLQKDAGTVGAITPDDASLRFDPKIAETGAHFREFDLASFRYPASVPTDANHVPTGTAVLAAFKRLNEFALATNPTSAITELIKGWYPTSSPNFNAGFVPSGWSAQPDLYKNTIAQSCRTCHVAIGNDSAINWTDYSIFKGFSKEVETLVCNRSIFPRMPHALITYLNFWTIASPTYPAKALAEFSDPPGWNPPGVAFKFDPGLDPTNPCSGL